MPRSTVNDASREVMAAGARWYKDTNGSLLTTGTGGAYLLATNNVHTALADQSLIVFQAHAANTANPTLKVDGLAAKSLKAGDGANLAANVIRLNQTVVVAYSAAADTYNLIGAVSPLTTEGDILYHGPNGLARLAIGTPNQVLRVNGAGDAPEYGSAGLFVQRESFQTGAVATGTAAITADDSIPQIGEGTQFMSRTITPDDAANELDITIVFNFAPDAGGTTAVTVALFKDSIADAIAAVPVNPGGNAFLTSVTFKHRITAGSTSLQTFTVRAGSNTINQITFNGVGGVRRLGGVNASSITIDEVQP